MNGATEQTLAELLAMASAMNVNLVKLNKLADEIRKNGVSGGGGAAGAAAGLASLTKSAGPLGLALGAITAAGDAVGAVFSGLGKIVGYTIGVISNVASGLVSFAMKAAEGTARLSDFYAAFKDLPLGFGSLATIFSKILQYGEALLVSYRRMTDAGASFSGDLFGMRVAAARAQMTMEEFTNVVKENSDIFATMGGNVQNGIDKFVDIQGALMGAKSPYARSLLNLGYSAETASSMLAGYIRSQGTLTRASLQSNDQIAKGVFAMATEMDLFSKITGVSREAMEKEVKKASFDAAWKTFTAGLGADERKAAEVAYAKTLTTLGQGAADMVRSGIMSQGEVIAPLTDAARQFYATTNGAADDFTKGMIDSVLKMKLGSEEQSKAQFAAIVLAAKGSKAYTDTLGTSGGILTMMNSKMVGAPEQLEAALKYANLTEEEFKKAYDKAKSDASKQQAGSASQFIEAERAIKEFGNTINELMARFMGPVASKLATWGNSIMQSVVSLVGDSGFIAAVDNTIKWFNQSWLHMQYAFSKEGMSGAIRAAIQRIGEGISKIWEIIGPAMKDLWKSIQPHLESVWNDFVDFLKPYFITMTESLMDMIGDWIHAKTGLGELSKDRKAREMAMGGGEFAAWRKSIEENTGMMGNFQRDKLKTGSDKEIYDMYKAQVGEGMWKQWGRKTMENDPRLIGSQPQPRASGGGISPGTYLVGEKGPELLNVGGSGDVVNNDNLTRLLAGAGNNNQAEAINQLNNLTAQLLQAQRESNELSRRQLSATKGLSGNLFA